MGCVITEAQPYPRRSFKLAKAVFLLSTGRTSTQSLAATVKAAMPEAIIEHEGLGADYFSRRVFRRPRRFEPILNQHVSIQQKFEQIESYLVAGKTYVDVGWPVYAWIPYLAKRFGDRLSFVHLVRNPFHVAASLTTHGLFVPESREGRKFEKRSMIHPGDPNIFFRSAAEQSAGFSPFERNLFHWAELNRFALEQHHTTGFSGFYRFEDVYKNGSSELEGLLRSMCGRDISRTDYIRTDSFHKSKTLGLSRVDETLLSAVYEVATQLGYSEDELNDSLDLQEIESRYANPRTR